MKGENRVAKKILIERPINDSLISFTESFIVGPKIYITVPIQYKAVVYIDDSSLFRIDPCKPFCFTKKYGSDHNGKKIKLAYIRWVNIEKSPWTVDKHTIDLPSKKKIDISSFGVYSFDIVNYPRLISSFPDKNNIALTDIRKKVNLAISSIVSQAIINDLSSDGEGAINETVSKIKNIFSNDLLLSSIGIRIVHFDISGIEIKDLSTEKEEIYV